MIIQTVALPVYNSKKIAWLALEGLCNQKDIDYKWELIVCEEKHKEQLGSSFFNLYKERLQKIGCDRIKYIELDGWIPLAEKWRLIGLEASQSSKSFILQAADCYPFETRLKEANYYVNIKNYDWLDYCKGYFYSFDLKKYFLYDFKGKTNLNMAFKTELAKQIKKSNKRKGVDGFLLKNAMQIKKIKKITLPELKNSGFDTDGLNNISTSRKKAFHNLKRQKRKVFKKPSQENVNLNIPQYIKEKIYELS